MSTTFPSELRRYLHTIDDIRQIAERRGIIRVYHGLPFLYARSFVRAVKEGRLTPKWGSAETIGRWIARLYDIPWVEFIHRTTAGSTMESYARADVDRVSTAPVAVAWRWATTAKYGEVADQLNEWARLMVEAKRRKMDFWTFQDMADRYVVKAKSETRSLADALGLPNRLAEYIGGAIIAIRVQSADVPEYARRLATLFYQAITDAPEETQGIIQEWNNRYIDIKVEHRKIRDARIIWVTPGTLLDGV